jgi:glucosamine 6-phosphate synthetase-like amidotransferase/phosphosugar isomerase protein
MPKYIDAFEAGCIYELVKTEYDEFRKLDKFNREEERYIESELTKITDKIKQMSFQSHTQIKSLRKRLDDIDHYIWTNGNKSRILKDLTNLANLNIS